MGACCTTDHDTKWEYKTLGPINDDESLNKLVAEGWKVVSFKINASGERYFLLKHKQTP